MSTTKFRVLLVLASLPVFALLSGHSVGELVSSVTGASSALDSPTITVTDAPATLVLRTPGTVAVQATAPAAPGDTIILDTAGAYGMGYVQVSKTVLDDNLQATLPVPGRAYLGTYKYWADIRATGTYQEGKSATFPIQIVAAPAPDAPTCGGDDPVKPDGTPWHCTYDDEFSGTTLDRNFWTPQVTETSGFTTGTKSMYACAEDNPDTINVADGYLDLSLIKLPADRACGTKKHSQYEFGQVMQYQTFSQTYGKYEIRAKIPDIGTPGAQESFWLWPVSNSYGAWPASGEIDFAEMYSAIAGLDRPYLHYLPGRTAGGTNENITHADCPYNIGEFNTFGLEWRPGQLKILLNGDVCLIDDYSSMAASFQGPNSPFDKPFYLSLNQAMGTTGNGYDPNLTPERVTTQVDYVRIWS